MLGNLTRRSRKFSRLTAARTHLADLHDATDDPKEITGPVQGRAPGALGIMGGEKKMEGGEGDAIRAIRTKAGLVAPIVVCRT